LVSSKSFLGQISLLYFVLVFAIDLDRGRTVERYIKTRLPDRLPANSTIWDFDFRNIDFLYSYCFDGQARSGGSCIDMGNHLGTSFCFRKLKPLHIHNIYLMSILYCIKCSYDVIWYYILQQNKKIEIKIKIDLRYSNDISNHRNIY